MDLWIKAGTSILAALDGTVYGFDFNAGKGNYGPTIILEHTIENQTFYTLYGHLSVESIENIEIGTLFKKGQTLATLGDSSVNGGYSPHLHFQIIKNIEDNFSDYPGVCSKNTLDFYLENCPDPNLLLKI
jgi:murein DD-endopeptidase MepM/ murein hydrolase activator NlpD